MLYCFTLFLDNLSRFSVCVADDDVVIDLCSTFYYDMIKFAKKVDSSAEIRERILFEEGH